MRRTTQTIVALFLFGAVAVWADQPVSGSRSAREALTLGASADSAPPADRLSILSLGQQRAEEAVRENSRDPMAHFAVFCNLGKRAEIRRGTHGFLTVLGDLGRIRREIDYTLALAPDYPAALAAKGQMPIELPKNRPCCAAPQASTRTIRRYVLCWPTVSRRPATPSDDLGPALAWIDPRAR